MKLPMKKANKMYIGKFPLKLLGDMPLYDPMKLEGRLSIAEFDIINSFIRSIAKVKYKQYLLSLTTALVGFLAYIITTYAAPVKGFLRNFLITLPLIIIATFAILKKNEVNKVIDEYLNQQSTSIFNSRNLLVKRQGCFLVFKGLYPEKSNKWMDGAFNHEKPSFKIFKGTSHNA